MFREKSFIIKVGITFILGGRRSREIQSSGERNSFGEKKFGGKKIYFKASRYRKIKTFRERICRCLQLYMCFSNKARDVKSLAQEKFSSLPIVNLSSKPRSYFVKPHRFVRCGRNILNASEIQELSCMSPRLQLEKSHQD